MPMVKVSTLFHRVDGFYESENKITFPIALDIEFVDSFLDRLLEPLIFDPGDDLVEKLLLKI